MDPERVKKVKELLDEVRSATKEALELWNGLDAEKVLELFKRFKELCPNCSSVLKAMDFDMYLPEDMKDTADKVRRLKHLYMSGYLALDIDRLYKIATSDDDIDIEPPKPYKGFWGIIFLLALLKSLH
ncbi:MAG: hypothetical protein QW575_08165 [Thermoproteota archaeon]